MKKKIFSIIYSLFIFLVLNIPSVKIIYSSEIINIFALVCLFGVGLLRVVFIDDYKILYTKRTIKFLILFLAMWIIIMILTLFNGSINLSLRNLLRYIVLISYVITVTLFTKYEDYKYIVILQSVWAGILSIMNFGGLIRLSRSLGQHYLTLGMPIGAGVVCMIGLLILDRGKLIKKVHWIFILGISLITLGSLRGRAPLLLSIIVPIISTLIMSFSEKGIINKIKIILPTTIALGLLGYFTYQNLSKVWIERFMDLFLFQESSRYYIYKTSIELFKNNPLGKGLISFDKYGFPYPHNIFLEIAITGGIIAFTIFIIISFIFGANIISKIKSKSYGTIVASLSLFFFLTWNISFNLSSSYIPFVGIALVMMSGFENQKINEIN